MTRLRQHETVHACPERPALVRLLGGTPNQTSVKNGRFFVSVVSTFDAPSQIFVGIAARMQQVDRIGTYHWGKIVYIRRSNAKNVGTEL